MKRASGLCEKLCNPSVIRVAHELSKLGKGHYREVKIVNSIMSYWGWIKPVNAKNLWRSVVDTKIIRILRNTNPNVKADI